MCAEVSVRSLGQRGLLRAPRRPQTSSDGKPGRDRGPRQGTARQTQAQAQVPPGTSSGPLPALLLTPSAGTQVHQQGSRMPGDGLGGQTSLWSGHGAEVPGPALPGPHQTAKHKAPLRRAGNQPFRSQGNRAAFPAPLFLPSSCE